MKIELAEDYEEKIFRSVMERRKKAQKIRKRVLCVIIIFTCLFGISSMSYSKFKKENYDNYFISNSENQLIEDEYEYFDGLGLKLNFINYAEDSIIIGFNIKYDDIANKEVTIEDLKILDNKENILYEKSNVLENQNMGCGDVYKTFVHKENKDEIIYMIKLDINDKEIKMDNIEIITKEIILADIKETKRLNIDWKRNIVK